MDTKKSVERFLFFLFPEALVKPTKRESTMNAHAEYEMPPNRAVHAWTLCGGIYISQRAFTAFLFWANEIYQIPESQNKR